jgi:hypothetical protein
MPSHYHGITNSQSVVTGLSTFDTGNADGTMSQGRVLCMSYSTINKGKVNDDYDDFHLWNTSGEHRAAWTDSAFIDGVSLSSMATYTDNVDSNGNNLPAYIDTNIWRRTV